MAKRRKTRQEKLIADLRRKLQSQASPVDDVASVHSSMYTLTQAKVEIPFPPTTYNLKPNTYTYVFSDLRKTAVLTTVAIIAQVILYFVLMR